MGRGVHWCGRCRRHSGKTAATASLRFCSLVEGWSCSSHAQIWWGFCLREATIGTRDPGSKGAGRQPGADRVPDDHRIRIARADRIRARIARRAIGLEGFAGGSQQRSHSISRDGTTFDWMVASCGYPTLGIGLGVLVLWIPLWSVRERVEYRPEGRRSRCRGRRTTSACRQATLRNRLRAHAPRGRRLALGSGVRMVNDPGWFRCPAAHAL